MTIVETFAEYIPQEWFDRAGLRISGHVLGKSATAIKRMRRWRNSVKGVSLSVALSASLALASVSFAQTAIASNGSDLPAPPELVRVAPPPAADASVGQINESFNELFVAFRSGIKLITNERTRELATKAAGRRGDRPEGWARKLASDVGDADD